jgi:hypothetical protein
MVPKNRLRKDIVNSRLFIYSGPFHPHFKQGLPQFTLPEPDDINAAFGFGKVIERRHDYKVIYESDPKNPPEELADVERDIDQEFDIPLGIREKTHTMPKDNIKMARAFRSNYKYLSKYKRTKE